MAHFIMIDGKLPSLVFASVDTTQLTGSGTHTHTGMSFSTADPRRTLIAFICVSFGTGGSVSSLSIGGVAATQVASVSVGGSSGTQIWVASVPTGTSGSISLSGVSGNWNSMVSLYAAYDLISNTPTATDTDTGFPVATSVAVQDNGVVVAGMGDFSVSPGTASWSGSVSQDFSQSFSPNALSGASLTATSAATASASGSFSGGGTASGCTAAFR